MAVSGDFFSIEGVRAVKDNAENSFNLLMAAQNLDVDNLINKTIIDIQNKIAELKSQESQFLSMFDCLDIEDFKRRVANYYNYTEFGHFTGSNLKRIVDDYKALTDKQTQERQELLERMIYNLINSEFFTKDFEGDLLAAFQSSQVTDEVANYVINKLIGALSGIGLGKGGMLRSTDFGGAGKTSDGKQIFEVAAQLTTSVFNAHLTDLQNALKSGKVAGVDKARETEILRNASILLKPHENTNISGLTMKQTFAVEWKTTIDKVTGGTGKQSDIKATPEELQKINHDLQQLVVNELMSYNTSANNGVMRQFINDRISSMLQKDPYMFFIGNAPAQLEGVLGEIAAVSAITALLGEKYRAKAVKWIGSQMGAYSKKQPSIDIALREIGGIQFGIQIKNTTKDLADDFLHNIKFVDASVDTVLSKLGISPQAFENVFFADNFNVPYKKRGARFIQVDKGPHHTDSLFPVYVKIDDAIDDIVAKITSYLMLFASDFLYIGMDQGFKSKLATLDSNVLTTGGNYVYIVGSQVFFASEMLMQLEQDLSALQNLQKEAEQTDLIIDSYIEKQKGDAKGAYNIVSVLNGRGGNVSSHTVKLRSSWNFHR